MYVKIHKLFEIFVDALEAKPEASVVHSLAQSPRLGEFLDELDPNLLLDWSAQSFQGMPQLRERVIARWGYGPECSPDDVLITAGTAEANFLAITQLVQPGDEMIVDVPGWPQPLVLGQAIGATIKRLHRQEAQGWGLDLAQLADLITPKTRLIFICNPNNPTGHVLGQRELEQVVTLAEQVGAYVLCDEVYRAMEWDHRPTPRVATMYERGISTGSVSKVLGLQGLRTGWLICRTPPLITDALVLRENSSEIMNIMGEAITNIALGEARFAQAIAQARQAGQHNLDLLDQFIERQPGLSWQRPQAGLIGLCRLDLPISADQFAAQLLAPPYRTFVMSGTAYGYPQHLRLGVGGGKAAAFAKGLERLEQLLDSLR